MDSTSSLATGWRTVVVGLAAGIGVALSSAMTVQASDQTCPVPFFVQDANAFPATLAVDQKGNGDGIVCVLILSTPDPAAAHFVIVDDSIPP